MSDMDATTPRILQDPTTGDVLHADEGHRREIAEAWANASHHERRADLANAALELAEAQIRQVLDHVEETEEAAADWDALPSISTRWLRELLTGDPRDLPAEEARAFVLKPEEVVRVQSWYYTAGDDFLPDNLDRDLARRLGNFAHVHVDRGQNDLPPYEDTPPEENFWDDRTHREMGE